MLSIIDILTDRYVMATSKNRTPEQKARDYASQQRWKERNKEKVIEAQRRYRDANRETIREKTRTQTRLWYFKNRYGITVAEYDLMLAAQGGRCAICRTDDPGARSWRVDHDHVTLKVRGLLCHNCNVSLGLMKDNIESIKSMLSYLEGHTHD